MVPPFKPIESIDMKFLLYKTALLLALTTLNRVGDLHVLSVHSSCTQFTPEGSKVTLHPNAYLPMVIPAAYSSMAFELLSFCEPPFASKEQRRLHAPCPVAFPLDCGECLPGFVATGSEGTFDQELHQELCLK